MDKSPEHTIEVERTGGFAGFGGPGSRLRSRGVLHWAHLTADDRQHLLTLLAEPATRSAPPAARGADGFRYRVTTLHEGQPVTLDLPEHLVPAALRDCVQDELL